jgi:UDP-N-acetylmuramyl pentapeptide phosphotransferase/UDP-N-acetylglucosamine-1-phosphate transferase
VEYFLLAAAVCGVSTLLLIRASKTHARASLDADFVKPQKHHAVAVPRIGGLGIFLGLAAAAIVMRWTMAPAASSLGLLLLACSLPAFLAGIIQDFTDTLTPRGRLLATCVSAGLAYFVVDAGIRDTDIPGLDWLVSFAAGSLVLTVFAVAGIANAINIIDGFNGLASMCLVLMLAALTYVAYQVADPVVAALALAGVGAVLGFFLWNFPAGMIFLGDGGAYFLGFYFAELSILLLHRNPGEVSPLFPLLVGFYPVFETLFSIYRRGLLRAASPSLPDGIHLHSLIYRRLLRWAVGDRSAKALTRRNSMTSPYLWLLCTFSIVPAVLFWDHSGVLAFFLLLFGVSYVMLYWRIVRFKSPRWMVLRPPLRRVPHVEADNQKT